MSSNSISLGSARSANQPRARSTADQRGAQQEGDPDRGEMAVRGALALVEPVGIDQCESGRQLGGAFVMIDDDHLDPGVLRERQRLERLQAPQSTVTISFVPPSPILSSASPEGP